MFTPPPSPQPSTTDGFSTSAPIPTPSNVCNSRNSDHTKRRTGRRFLWTAILVPFIVIAFTVYGRFSTRLVSSASSPLSWHGLISDQSNWKREPQVPTSSIAPSPSSPSAPTPATSSSVPAASQVLPTVPSSPIVPTPFPQAFDSIITQNFSTSSCLNFFNNMTASTTFRECRPFSFLYSTSSIFMNAQTNLTLTNALIWGTCNTPMANDQCQSNMASFASSLHTACSQELNNQNLLVVNSLIALQAFQVMYESACLVNPITNAYCYLSAVQNSNPSDLYFYSLPLGIPLPKTSTPSCSVCSRTIMGIYATTLQVPSQAKLLTALKSAYIVSAEIAAQFCGAGFAMTIASAAMSLSCGWRIIFVGFVFTWTLTHYS